MALDRTIALRASSAPASGIRAIFNRAQSIADYVNLGLGEPDYDTPSHIIEAAFRAAQAGETHYTVNAGLKELRTEISNAIAREKGAHFDANGSIIATAGGMGGLYLATQTLINPGDEVLLIEPYWPNYLSQVILAGGQPVIVSSNAGNGFQPMIENIESAVTSRTKLLILNSPANPTGAVVDGSALSAIATIAERNGFFVLSDDVYDKFVWAMPTVPSMASFASTRDWVILVNSFSKTYAMTGWRIGYAAGPPEVIGAMTKLQESIYACPSTVSQYGAIAALSGSQAPVEEMIADYSRRRSLVAERLGRIPSLETDKPAGSFYFFVDIAGTGLTSETFAHTLLEEEYVAVVPGTAFGAGGEGYIRLSYAAATTELEKGLDGIERLCARLSS